MPWLGLAALLLVSRAEAAAQEATGEPVAKQEGNLRVETDKVWPMPAMGHPFPLRVRMENRGPAREIEYAVDSRMGWGGGDRTWNVTRRFRLADGERAEFSLLVPASSAYMGLEVRVDGRKADDLGGSINANQAYGAHLVIDGRRDFSQAQLETSFPDRGRGQPPCVLLPANRLCGQWQAYAGLGGVWARAAEWRALGVPEREAILKAVKAGQTLVLYETDDAPLVGRGALLPPESVAGWTSPLGGIESIAPDIEGVRLGMGRAFRVPGRLIGPSANLPHRFRADGRDVVKRVFAAPGFLAVPGVSEVPHVAFFWIVFFFALIIGPINLLFVRRLGKRMVFVVTTPLIALLSVSTLFAYSAFREGFGLKASVRSFTLLNPEARESVVVSAASVYSGMSTGTWRYRPETLVLGVPKRDMGDDEESYRSYRRREDRTVSSNLDWTRGQEVSSWVPARERTVVAAVQVGADRSRLMVEKAGAGLRIHNALGVDIERGILNWEGRTWPLPALPAGGAAEISAAPPSFPVPNGVFNPRSLDLGVSAAGEFVVVTSMNPSLDRGEKSMEERGGFHVVKGRATEQK
jgi:hypothetical protein